MKIRLDNEHSGYIKLTEGVLQGDPLSPLLFNLFISDIELAIPSSVGRGVRVGQHEIHILQYADDTVILSSSAYSLQNKINSLSEYFKKLDLHLNIDKTKVIVL